MCAWRMQAVLGQVALLHEAQPHVAAAGMPQELLPEVPGEVSKGAALSHMTHCLRLWSRVPDSHLTAHDATGARRCCIPQPPWQKSTMDGPW